MKFFIILFAFQSVFEAKAQISVPKDPEGKGVSGPAPKEVNGEQVIIRLPDETKKTILKPGTIVVDKEDTTPKIKIPSDTWGSPDYSIVGAQTPTQQFKYNGEILGVAKKVLCRYLSTSSFESSIQSSGKFGLSSKGQKENLDKINADLNKHIKNYCEKMNPESIPGSVKSQCLNSCKTVFKSSSYKSDIDDCDSACEAYVAKFETMPKAVIEALKVEAHAQKEGPATPCLENVNSTSRSPKDVGERKTGAHSSRTGVKAE